MQQSFLLDFSYLFQDSENFYIIAHIKFKDRIDGSLGLFSANYHNFVGIFVKYGSALDRERDFPIKKFPFKSFVI